MHIKLTKYSELSLQDEAGSFTASEGLSSLDMIVEYITVSYISST